MNARANCQSQSEPIRRRRCQGEGGVFTPWFVVLVVPMMMMAGLVFDGGHVLAERRQALDIAQNAALAGAQAIDEGQVRQGAVAVNPQLVVNSAQTYLSNNGYSGTVTVSNTEVTVVVTQTVDMQLLSAIGVGAKTVTGTATARIVRGVEGADT
jgi:Flp pilus assembly protein TadG